MKVPLISTSCVLAFAMLASSAGTLFGSYATTVSGSPVGALNGSWVVTFTAKDTYAITKDGALVVSGRDSITGSTVRLGHETGPYACRGSQAPAVYHWAVRKGKLTMAPLSERCQGRRLILSSRALTKKQPTKK